MIHSDIISGQHHVARRPICWGKR
uniref:Uncharacterized protein n=1 Tax=Arundo donax TaxID=35708 RepID=A0A0A9CWG2_ARUDO